MKITHKLLKSFDPCDSGWENYLKHYRDWSGTVLEFCELKHVPADDKLWILLRKEFINEKELYYLSCDFALNVIDNFESEHPDDKRPRNAIETKLKWINGDASDDELKAARSAAWSAASCAANSTACSAARSAAYSAAYSAASRAELNAADSAARSAAWSTANNAERQEQLDLVVLALVK